MNRLGLRLATGYAAVLLILVAFAIYHSKPENMGYQWIPVFVLSLPWSILIPFGGISAIGGILNALLLYGLGVGMSRLK